MAARHSSRPPGRHGPGRGRAPSLDATGIDAALAGIVPDARDRAFVLRCVLEEGPRHHRVASWALLRMLAAILTEVGGAPDATHEAPRVPLEMRLPPSVSSSSDDAEFPIGIPTSLLESLMDAPHTRLALECLADGPPHHALANAAMVWLLQAIYDRVTSPRSSPAE